LKITSEEILKAAKLLKNKKCYGPDGIPLKIIKDLAQKQPHILEFTLNEFATKGLPYTIKTSRVIPLHKKGDKSEVSNYRPISNLCSIGKLYEKILLEKLNIETDGMEGAFQHGYRKHHSTTTALLEIQSRISSHLEAGQMVVVYSIDLSAAFDLLRPGLLDLVLEESGASKDLRWSIQDFLSQRNVYVDINAVRSKEKLMKIGCVQGSILGPRLFTLYLGKLVEALKHDEVVTYADDSYVILHGKTLEELQEKVKIPIK